MSVLPLSLARAAPASGDGWEWLRRAQELQVPHGFSPGFSPAAPTLLFGARGCSCGAGGHAGHVPLTRASCRVPLTRAPCRWRVPRAGCALRCPGAAGAGGCGGLRGSSPVPAATPNQTGRKQQNISRVGSTAFRDGTQSLVSVLLKTD